MADEGEWLKVLGLDNQAQLLVHLAAQRLLGRFVRLKLATGDLPLASGRFTRGALCKKSAPLCIDQQSGGYGYQF